MKTKTKLLGVLILLIATVFTASAYDFEVDGIYYNKTSDTEVEVTYKNSDNKYYYVGSVTIPASVTYDGTTYSVTAIGEKAFYYCIYLTSVTIPNSVTTIGYYAFCYCSGLTSVTIPNSVKTIGYEAFYYCIYLTSVTIPNSVTNIGSYAFYNCSGLTSVTIPNSVTNIGTNAFYDCTSLTSVTIPNSVTNIGTYAFYGCSGLIKSAYPNHLSNPFSNGISISYDGDNSIIENGFIYNADKTTLIFAPIDLTTLTIPNSVTTIGNQAFSGCSGLTSVTIPNSVTNIGSYAFYNCRGLTSVTIPNSVKTIGYEAFYNCSGLTSVTIPNSVTNIGYYAFDGCSGLIKSAYPNHLSNPFSNGISISYDGDNSIIENGIIYNADKTTLIFAPIDLTTLTIPNSVTTIGNQAFYRCSGLTSLTISNSMTEIGDGAFYDCSGLKSVTIGAGVTSIGYRAFSTTISKVIWLCNTPPSSANNVSAKVNYVSNEQFSISNRKVYPFLSSKFEVDGVVYVPVSPSERTCDVIDCNYAPTSTDIVIDSIVSNKNVQLKVLEVNPYSFYDNDSITSLKIQNSGNIGDQAFYDCDAITIVDASNNGNIGDQAFYNCDALTTAKLSNKGNIASQAFYDCTKLESVTFGPKVTSIQESAFYNCKSLKSLTLPDNISSLGESAFYNCNSLSNVFLGKGINSLPKNVFRGCSSLPSLTIPANIESIGNYAFSGCTQLADVTFEGVNKDSSQISISLGSNGSSPLFASCPLDEVYIGRKLSYQTSSSYGYSPFYRNTSLRSVKISDIETQIYNNEFYGCSNLQEFSCGDGVTTIGSWAFSGCSAMTSFASGSKVKSIGQEAFSDCTGLISFTSLAAVPPTCGNQALDDINKWECVLHVPAESIDDYQAAEQWKEFFFMEETQGVDDVITDAAAGEVVGYYNLQGIRSDEPWEGLNIVVYSDGTRRKIRY